MAKIRFPGRPGNRIGRTSAKYHHDVSVPADQSIGAVDDIKEKWQSFIEKFGNSSDEEEEFLGFSTKEISEAWTFVVEDSVADVAILSNAKSVSSLVKTRLSVTGIRRTYDDLIKSGLCAESKIPKDFDQNEKSKKNNKKVHKSKLSNNRLLAKHLVNKARLKKTKTEESDIKKNVQRRKKKFEDKNSREIKYKCDKRSDICNKKNLITLAEHKTKNFYSKVSPQFKRQRRKVILPVKSTISSRKIIPPRRFSDNVSSAIKYEEECSDFYSPHACLPNSSEDRSQKIGLLEQPLIIEGKRPWKPSFKVQMRLSDSSYEVKNTPKSVDNKSNSSNTLSSGSSKELIRQDISKYTDQMVTSTVESDKKTHIKPVTKIAGLIKPARLTFKSSLEKKSEEEEKKARRDERKRSQINIKVTAKIEKLLKSQWEDRLRKPGRNPWKTCAMKREMYMWPSTLKNMHFNKQSENESQALAQQRASAQRQTKNIIKKARLQLNKRTLQKLRKPTTVEKLNKIFSQDQQNVQSSIKLSSFPIVDLKCVDSSCDKSVSSANKTSKDITESAIFGEPIIKNCSVCGQTKVQSQIKMFNNQLSCDTCRHFFSNFLNSPKQLFCDKSGKCKINSGDSLSSQTCEACWLKLCFRSFASTPTLLILAKKFAPKIALNTHKLDKAVFKTKFLHLIASSGDEISFSSLIQSKAESVIKAKTTSNASSEVSKDFQKSEQSQDISGEIKPSKKQKIVRGGPRIKHVCRRASAVLGLSPAMFPLPPELLNVNRSEIYPVQNVSTNNSVNHSNVLPVPSKLSLPTTVERNDESKFSKPKIKHSTEKKERMRCSRCKICESCKTDPCGQCGNCLDKPRFGGRGVLKKACLKRICKNPVLPNKTKKKMQAKPHISPQHYETLQSQECNRLESVIDNTSFQNPKNVEKPHHEDNNSHFHLSDQATSRKDCIKKGETLKDGGAELCPKQSSSSRNGLTDCQQQLHSENSKLKRNIRSKAKELKKAKIKPNTKMKACKQPDAIKFYKTLGRSLPNLEL
ncbi:Histone-lysine N-methyltransferase 2B [Nymphon striatum]|nr:Histone-lysine N-methyltransferase 2B [Nymphon striatum]